jgi:hypothetical protein
VVGVGKLRRAEAYERALLAAAPRPAAAFSPRRRSTGSGS